jgi:hypothetical protein
VMAALGGAAAFGGKAGFGAAVAVNVIQMKPSPRFRVTTISSIAS